MVCDGCGQLASHIFSNEYGEHCENCGDISVISKKKTDGLITRNSWRIRRQQSRYEGDMVTPHVYDKTKHRQTVNPDFVKLYPDKVKEYFTGDQLKKEGYTKMPEAIAKNEVRREKQKAKFVNDTVYSGSSKKAIGNFLGEKV